MYSFLALTINRWKYFYLASCTHKDFGWIRTSPTSVLEKERLYHSAQKYMMAERHWQQKFPRQTKIPPCHYERKNAPIFFFFLMFISFSAEERDLKKTDLCSSAYFTDKHTPSASKLPLPVRSSIYINSNLLKKSPLRSFFPRFLDGHW